MLRQALHERSLLGLVAGTVLLGASLTPSLTPRPPELMGVLAGICLALGYLAGIAVSAAYSFLGFVLPQVRGGLTRLIMVACAGFAAAFFWLSIDWQNQLRTLFDLPPLGRGSVFVVVAVAIATFGMLFLIGVGCRALYRITSAWFDKRVPRRVAIVLGVAISGLVVWALLSGVLFRFGLRLFDSSFREVDALVEPDVIAPGDPFQTGSPASLIEWDSLGRMGRQYISTGPTTADIQAVAGGTDARPVRVYAGLNSAETATDRARLALAELKRVGGFDRSVLVIIAPTGTGWVDPNAIDTLEFLHRGDVASVAVQYSYLASWLSLTVEPDYGVESAKALFREVYAHWTQLPRDSRPRLYLFGLSLGALSSEQSMDLFDVIEDPIQGALWAGPPFPSPLWNSATANREPGTPVWLPRFKDSSIVRFTSQRNNLNRAGDRWGPIRIVYLQYGSDPITFFRPDSFYRRPEWLTDPRAPDVLPSLRWVPGVTFMQTAVDLMTAAVTPTGTGHVYAAEHYLDGWVAVTDAPGWSEPAITKLRETVAEKYADPGS